MSRKPWVLRLVLTLVVSAFPTLALCQPANCDARYVVQYSETWQVFPNGTDDTVNFQCAFDHAVTVPGSTVLLAGGNYHIGQVVASGFVGTFRGAGMDQTVIQTLDRPLRVTYLGFEFNVPTPESGSNPWPSIFAFVGGDIVVSDLSLYATENSGTTGWTLPGLGLNVYELAHGFVVLGSEVPGQSYREANAALYRVHVEGLARAGTLYGYNLINASYDEGFLGVDLLPLKGTFDVHDCMIKHNGGTNIYNLYGSKVSMTGNTYSDSFEGMDIGQLVNTSWEFSHNRALDISTWGVYVYGPWASSSITIDQNVFTGVNGPYFDDAVNFSGQKACHIIQNAVEQETGVGIYLGAGTSGCEVVCASPTDVVRNAGTDNRLVACILKK